MGAILGAVVPTACAADPCRCLNILPVLLVTFSCVLLGSICPMTASPLSATAFTFPVSTPSSPRLEGLLQFLGRLGGRLQHTVGASGPADLGEHQLQGLLLLLLGAEQPYL